MFYLPAKQLPRLDPAELRAGCVIDTGVLKLVTPATAMPLQSVHNAPGVEGVLQERVTEHPKA